jgi:hypothetical protein
MITLTEINKMKVKKTEDGIEDEDLGVTARTMELSIQLG